MKFTAYNKNTGQVQFSGDGYDPQILETDEVGVLLGFEYGDGWLDEDLEHHEVPVRPSAHHTFDWSAKEWQDARTLEQIKEHHWVEIKKERDRREFSTFTWDGSVFDCDQHSQQRIQGAAQLATLAQLTNDPFEIDWTLNDNTVRTLSASEMIAVGTAMGVHVSTLHATGRVLRQAIEAATTKADVLAVSW